MSEEEFASSTSGAKREALGVPYFRQLPLEALAAASAALEYGAIKYDNRNWEKGLPWQQMIDSLRRHLDDFERRHDYDDGAKGSGLPQVSMIMASAMMLVASVIREIGIDDRMVQPSKEALSAKECALWIKNSMEKADEIMKGK
jgi:hypothetical protein